MWTYISCRHSYVDKYMVLVSIQTKNCICRHILSLNQYMKYIQNGVLCNVIHDNNNIFVYKLNNLQPLHYKYIIMSAMASQITSLTIVYSTVYSRCKSKITAKLRHSGFGVGNSPVTGEFPAQGASNAVNASIWWRHRVCRVELVFSTRLTSAIIFPCLCN